jgi:hypothetical protein
MACRIIGLVLGKGFGFSLVPFALQCFAIRVALRLVPFCLIISQKHFCPIIYKFIETKKESI